MRLLLLFILFPSLLLASKILSYNIYDRTDRVDLMLTFDTPFEGSLRQIRQQDKIIVKLSQTSINSPKIKNITSPFISKLTITPIGEETQIIAKVPPSVSLQASKTSDAYGLRLRFSKTAPAAAVQATKPDVSALPTKPEGEFSNSYYVVITILIIGIIILLLIKRRIGKSIPSAPKAPSKPWLLGGKKQKKEDVTVRFQKAIDQKNRVVMLDYEDASYLVLVGSTNMLLDKFYDSKPVTENEFNDMLQKKHNELDSFLQLEKEKEPLQSYKEKASGLDLDELIDRSV